jgi:phosphohistidine phosphatase
MKLLLLRHAEAAPTLPDESRQLTRKGERQVAQLVEQLKGHGEVDAITAIWHSPYTRAVDTARLFKAGLGLRAPLIETSGLTPCDDARATAERIHREEGAGKTLLVVGHNPHMESLCDYLLTGENYRQTVIFKKAGLFCLESHPGVQIAGGYGQWSCCWYLIPRLL